LNPEPDPSISDRIEELMREGDFLIHIGRSQEAFAFFDEILSIMPNNVQAIDGMARASERLGKYTDSINCYDQILTIHPDNDFALWGKALLFEKMKRYEDSIVCLDTIEEIARKRNRLDNELIFRIKSTRAILYSKIGAIDSALKNLEEAFKLKPFHKKIVALRAKEKHPDYANILDDTRFTKLLEE
jgi:tetratricopeptide (TPR) repeat protein